MTPLISFKQVSKRYALRGSEFRALDDVSLDIYPGEVVGLVGESGSGKSTLGRLALGLEAPSSGTVAFDGNDLTSLNRAELKAFRCQAQIVFQDPHASLNPRMTVLDIVAEGLDIHRLARRHERKARVAQLLGLVGLGEECLHRFPHEFSGGQRQRICIARALAVRPKFLVCDEPTSALDLSIQAQVINLLRKLKQEMQLTYLFIAHDLSVVRYLSDRVAVMHQGKLVELASSKRLFSQPKHNQTKALIAASSFALA